MSELLVIKVTPTFECKAKKLLAAKALEEFFYYLEAYFDKGDLIHSKGKGKRMRSKLDIQEVRKKLGMSQKELATQYYIKLQTLRNWEQEKRIPDTTSLAYLTCIASHPKEILKILQSPNKSKKYL